MSFQWQVHSREQLHGHGGRRRPRQPNHVLLRPQGLLHHAQRGGGLPVSGQTDRIKDRQNQRQTESKTDRIKDRQNRRQLRKQSDRVKKKSVEPTKKETEKEKIGR